MFVYLLLFISINNQIKVGISKTDIVSDIVAYCIPLNLMRHSASTCIDRKTVIAIKTSLWMKETQEIFQKYLLYLE